MKLINHINTQLLHRRIVLVLFDIMTACVAGVIPLWIRFELNFNDIPNVYLESVWNFMLINVVITLIVFYMFRLYHSLWAFAGTAEAQNIVAACFLCAVLNFLGMNLLKYPIPRSYYFMYALVLTGIITLGRFSYRIVRGRVHKSQNKKNGTRVMIIGAGDAGNTVIKEITNSHFSTMVIKCIIDDNENKWGRFIQGIKIVGGRDKIVEYAELILQKLPAEVSAAMCKNGVFLSGGVCNLAGFADYVGEKLQMETHLAGDAQMAVVLGGGRAVGNTALLRAIRLE